MTTEPLEGRVDSDISVRRKQCLKVTYVVGTLQDAGTERQVLELMRRINRDNFEISLMLLEDTNSDRADGLVQQRFVLGVPQGGNSLWMRRSLSLSRAAFLAKRRLREIQSDIVHAFLPGPCILAGLAARVASVPVIIGSRRSLPSQYRSHKQVAAWADSAAFRLAHFNLGNSEAVTREMIDIGGCPSSKCGTIYNGVDLQTYAPNLQSSLRHELGWTNGEVVLGMVANFRPCKRHCDFVAAAGIISRQEPTARFIMLGADSGTKQAVLHQVAALSLQEKFRILDSTPSPETVLAALDVCVCSSTGEGFSNVLLESMACGKPVIATNVGGNAEAVSPESGILVSPQMPEEIAQSAIRLIADPMLRRKMGIAGRMRAECKFSIDSMVRAHESLYLKLFDELGNGKSGFARDTQN